MKKRNAVFNKIRSSVPVQCYLLLAMPIIGFFAFTLYPIIWAAAKAFYFYDGSMINTRFTGLENFHTLFGDKQYWNAWMFTLKLTGLKMIIEIPCALVLAVLTSKMKKLGGFFRGAFFLPNVVSVAIVGVIFTNLFDYFGFTNAILKMIGLKSVDWFASNGTATTVLLSGSVWSSFGINVLYFSAAITNVPKELYEAAEIDGAGESTKFFRITIPMIAPVFQTILLLAINGTLHISEYIIAVTNGAPGGTTNTVGSYIVSKFVPGFFASGVPNIGYGCAMSLLTSVFYGLIAILYMKVSKKMSEVY